MVGNIINIPFEILELMFSNGNYETNAFIASVFLVMIFGIVGWVFRWIIK